MNEELAFEEGFKTEIVEEIKPKWDEEKFNELYEELKEKNNELETLIESMQDRNEISESVRDQIEFLQQENKELKDQNKAFSVYEDKKLSEKYKKLLAITKLVFSQAYEDEPFKFEELVIKKKDHLEKFDMR